MALSTDELRMLAKLEGRPLPRGQVLADLLGVSPTTAWRLVRRLRRQGALRFVSTARLRPRTCQCITYLKVDWAGLRSLESLDDKLRRDPAIMTADRITGGCDYRLLSRHADYQSANAWTRDIESHPSVARAETRFCASMWDRPHYAAARLAADHPQTSDRRDRECRA